MDCANCELRKAVARAFDLHWMGEEDCPFVCGKKDSALQHVETVAKEEKMNNG